MATAAQIACSDLSNAFTPRRVELTTSASFTVLHVDVNLEKSNMHSTAAKPALCTQAVNTEAHYVLRVQRG